MLRNLKENALFLIVGLYLLFNYGFMQVRFPPAGGTGVPIGEIFLLLFLLTINHVRVFRRLSSTIWLAPFAVWWALGLGRALIDMQQYGFWALRDATHVIESLFIIPGFVIASSRRALDKFFDWLPKVLLVGVFYGLSYPFGEALRGLSPKLISGAGYEASLLFNYTNTSMLLLMAAFYLLLFSPKDGSMAKAAFPISVILIGFATFAFQARTIYLQLIFVSLVLWRYRSSLFGKSLVAVVLLFVFLFTMPILGLQLTGRLGQPVSVEFLANHFMAIGGTESAGVEGAAGGVPQRLGWWSSIYDRSTADASSFLLGQGYGFPLVDFVAFGQGYDEGGQVVREPHNSYVSIFARIGLLGLVAFVLMQLSLFRVWKQTFQRCVSLGWRDGENRLLLLSVFFVLALVLAIGEDGFEKPYNAIPYYFFWGITLGFANLLKQGTIGPGEAGNENTPVA